MKTILPRINTRVLSSTIKTSLTAEQLFRSLPDTRNTALLNSSLKTDAGRYSFIGTAPFCTIKASDENIDIRMAGKTLKMKKDPFLILKDIFDVIKINNPSRFPLAGGGIGYFSYDLKDSIEKIPDTSINDLALPEMYFVLYQAIMAFDNEDPGKVLITVLDIRSDDLPKAQDLLISLKKTAVSGIPFAYADRRTSSGKPRSNFTKKDYITAVEKVKEYIRSGDIYQACLSQRFEADWARGPYLLYKKLNNLNPSPFSAFLNFEDCEILSSSPELFLRAGGKKIETRPMKGTRTRGKDPLTDKRMRNDLLKSDKDAAELSMIVDLERNDLGKIAVPGSVFVSEHRRIEKYSTVFQTISVINAELPDNISLPLVVKAAFPGGSISGCPKIRAMEIIEELEPTKRSVYTGCIGYISFHGTMDLNIAIRTITLKNGKAYYQTGGGITIDSAPEEEYRETLDKARAFFDILGADLI